MSDATDGFLWNEDQWSRARKVLQESARRARVASSFLPLVGPLPADEITVKALPLETESADRLGRGEADSRLKIDDTITVPLTTISIDIYLHTYEAADPEMSAALDMIGRAADVLGRLEDSIIFNGQPGKGEAPNPPNSPSLPTIYRVNGGESREGLLNASDSEMVVNVNMSGGNKSSSIVEQTVHAISLLEGNAHYGPFAQVLGTDLYLAANTPNKNSMVLPADRILPFLDGPLLRSSTMPRDQGVVVALGGSPIDLVVAQDLNLKFVQMSVEPRYILRMSERFTLRIKQRGAVCRLQAEYL